MSQRGDFSVPKPNDLNEVQKRNKKLSAELATSSKDVVTIYLETLPNGKTCWWLVTRDGKQSPLDNS